MKRRDSIIEDLHKLRERIGRAHDFDVDRIAATIRQHEREAGRAPVDATPKRANVGPSLAIEGLPNNAIRLFRL